MKKQVFDFDEELLQAFDKLIYAVSDGINDYKLEVNPEDKIIFESLFKDITNIKMSYLKSKSLINIDDKTMQKIFKNCEYLFNKYLVDELDLYISTIKYYYNLDLKKHFVEDLRNKRM